MDYYANIIDCYIEPIPESLEKKTSKRKRKGKYIFKTESEARAFLMAYTRRMVRDLRKKKVKIDKDLQRYEESLQDQIEYFRKSTLT